MSGILLKLGAHHIQNNFVNKKFGFILTLFFENCFMQEVILNLFKKETQFLFRNWVSKLIGGAFNGAVAKRSKAKVCNTFIRRFCRRHSFGRIRPALPTLFYTFLCCIYLFSKKYLYLLLYPNFLTNFPMALSIIKIFDFR